MKILIFSCIFFSFSTFAGLSINSAWVKNAPPVVPVRAAYLTLNNDSDNAIIINKITSPQFQMIEAHETFLNNGVYSMKPISELSIGARSSVTLEPKGKHLMLMMPSKPINELTHIQLEFHSSDGQIIRVNAPIKNSL